MSDNTNPTAAVNAEVETPKKKFFRKPNLHINKTKIRNGAALVAAGAVAVLVVQKKAGKTVDFDLSTADIDNGSDD